MLSRSSAPPRRLSAARSCRCSGEDKTQIAADRDCNSTRPAFCTGFPLRPHKCRAGTSRGADKPRADKVIGTVKVLQNGKAMIKARDSDREAVIATLEFVLWWLNDCPDHPSAHRPLGYTVLDDGSVQV